MWDFFKDIPHLTWTYLKSREGKKCVRRCIMPLIVMGALMMLIVGAIWAKFQYPECGTDLDSAKFQVRKVSSSARELIGNSCPGYDWRGQKSIYTAGEHHYEVNLPLYPRIANNPFYVDDSLIGYALNSVPIYAGGRSDESDVVKVQAYKYESCGGSVSNPVGVTFNLPITGVFRYFSMPGDGKPLDHADDLNVNFHLCSASHMWYKETNASTHSPISGFLADGIPIYGPKGGNGSAPTDLDECGGHDTDLPFYHYHFTSSFPYSVKCLLGCLDGSIDSSLDSGNCDVNKTATLRSNYSSIANLTIMYGGAGVNSTDWSGPTCLLVFGFIIFIPGMLCGICMLCGKRIAKWKDKRPLNEQNEEEEDDDSVDWADDDEDELSDYDSDEWEEYYSDEEEEEKKDDKKASSSRSSSKV